MGVSRAGFVEAMGVLFGLAGLAPSEYRFFGVAWETMFSYFRRTLYVDSEQYCPACTRDLPRPDRY